MSPEPRTVSVKGWLNRFSFRQHLELKGIEFTEDRGQYGSVFTVEATPEQWDELQQLEGVER